MFRRLGYQDTKTWETGISAKVAGKVEFYGGMDFQTRLVPHSCSDHGQVRWNLKGGAILLPHADVAKKGNSDLRTTASIESLIVTASFYWEHKANA